MTKTNFIAADDVHGLFKAGYLQKVRITIAGPKETRILTGKDIVKGGLVIDRYCASGKRIEIGSAIASELTLKINNNSGQFDGMIFEGAEVVVDVIIQKWDAMQWEHALPHEVRMGIFTVDSPPRKLSTITLTCYDRMMLFDKPYDSKLPYPTTVEQILADACCNRADLATSLSSLPNYDMEVTTRPTGDVTYRQILQWVAEITGTCAYIDAYGQTKLEWFKYSDNDPIIAPSDRTTTSELSEAPITITGVQTVDSKGNEYISEGDTTAYYFNIEGNGLLQHGHQGVANILAHGDAEYGNEAIRGFTYRPFSCVTKPMPLMWPLQTIWYVDAAGEKHRSIVTHWNFTLNGNTKISAVGETATRAGYATLPPLTREQTTIIEALQRDVDNYISEGAQALVDLNEKARASNGYYTTISKDPVTGAEIVYRHDQVLLEDSSKVHKTTLDGEFWTTEFHGEGRDAENNYLTVWKSGMTAEGDAVFRMISAKSLLLTSNDSKTSTIITNDTFKIRYRNDDALTINAGKSYLTKVAFTEYLEVGKARMMPHTDINGVIDGANLVVID